MASFPDRVGLPDRHWTDGLRHWGAVFNLSERGGYGGSGDVKSVHSARLGSRDSIHIFNTAAVDGVLHLLGDCV